MREWTANLDLPTGQTSCQSYGSCCGPQDIPLLHLRLLPGPLWAYSPNSKGERQQQSRVWTGGGIRAGCQACCPSVPSAQHCEQERGFIPSTSSMSKDTSFNIRNHSRGFVSLKDAPVVFFSISVHPHPEQDVTTPIYPGFLQSDFHSFCLDCRLTGLLLTSRWRCTVTVFASFAQAQHLQTAFCSQVGKCSICFHTAKSRLYSKPSANFI